MSKRTLPIVVCTTIWEYRESVLHERRTVSNHTVSLSLAFLGLAVEQVNNMKERGNNQSEEKHVHLPPAWCGSICRNAMNEICIEHCAIERDTSAFEPRQNLKLADMPRFPKTEGMTKEEKFTSVTVYLSKVVDHLQGVEHGESFVSYPRPNPNGSTGRRISPNIQVKDLLPDIQKANSSYQNPEERSSEGVGPEEVAGSSD